MKKRLLITSIVMMLVVAVALSTATYAWFTSNTSVTASTVTMTAGTSASSALGISWTKSAGTPGQPAFNSHYGTVVNPYEYSGTLQPAAPNALASSDPTFYTAFINAQGAFLANGVETPVFRFANNSSSSAEGYSNLIHVANLAQSGSVGVTITATITGHFVAITSAEDTDTTNYDYYDADKALIASPGSSVSTGYKVAKNNAAALVRIAVFEVSTTTTDYDTYTFKGTLASATGSNNTAVGSIVKDATASALLTGHDTVTTITLSNIAAQTDQAYAVYVWLDGALFNEAESNKTADVSLTFASV